MVLYLHSILNRITQFTFISQYDVGFYKLDILTTCEYSFGSNEKCSFDGTVLITPILVNANDSIKIRVNKPLVVKVFLKLKKHNVK
jgi:hypothetical protein